MTIWTIRPVQKKDNTENERWLIFDLLVRILSIIHSQDQATDQWSTSVDLKNHPYFWWENELNKIELIAVNREAAKGKYFLFKVIWRGVCK